MNHVRIKHFNSDLCESSSAEEFGYNLSTYGFRDKETMRNMWNLFIKHLRSTRLSSYFNSDELLNQYYLFCPTYIGYRPIPDYQYAITGSRSENDRNSNYLAMNRELGEEIGVKIPKGLQVQQYQTVIWESNIVFSFINIGQLQYLNERDVSFSPKKGKDNRKHKVWVFLYGSEEDVQNYCNSSIFRYKDVKEHEYLAQISMIPVKFIHMKLQKIFQNVQSTKNNITTIPMPKQKSKPIKSDFEKAYEQKLEEAKVEYGITKKSFKKTKPSPTKKKSPLLWRSSKIKSPIKSPLKSPTRYTTRLKSKSPVRYPTRRQSPTRKPIGRSSPTRKPIRRSSPTRKPTRKSSKSPIRKASPSRNWRAPARK